MMFACSRIVYSFSVSSPNPLSTDSEFMLCWQVHTCFLLFWWQLAICVLCSFSLSSFELSLTIFCCISDFLCWPYLSSNDVICGFASGEGVTGPVVRPTVRTHVSGPVVRPTDGTHARFVTNGYARMKHGHGWFYGIEMISWGLLNKSSLFQHIMLCVVWLD